MFSLRIEKTLGRIELELKSPEDKIEASPIALCCLINISSDFWITAGLQFEASNTAPHPPTSTSSERAK